MTFRFRRRFVRQRDGSFSIRLDEDERRLLATLPDQLASLVQADPADPWLQRLFPTAYPKDPELEPEWRLLMSVDVPDRRQDQLRVLADTAGATSATEEELQGWAQALNFLRLYVGTRLEVSEETEIDDIGDEYDRQLFLLYNWLGLLQEDAIQALAESL